MGIAWAATGFVVDDEIVGLSVICNIRVCVRLGNNASVETSPENFGRKAHLVYASVVQRWKLDVL
jgi:hypothetical protein